MLIGEGTERCRIKVNDVKNNVFIFLNEALTRVRLHPINTIKPRKKKLSAITLSFRKLELYEQFYLIVTDLPVLLPFQSQHTPSPGFTHQLINLLHLQSLATTLHKLTHLCHLSAGLKVTRLQGCSSLHWSMSACLPVYPGSGPCLRKRKFTNS